MRERRWCRESHQQAGVSITKTNVAGGINLLTAMKHLRCKNLIFSSTCATYGIPETVPIREDFPQNPINPYGETKLAFETRAALVSRNITGLEYLVPALLQCSGRRFRWREFGEHHDPETHLIPLVLDAALGRRPEVQIFGTDYPTPDGTCLRDYIHVTGSCDAHMLRDCRR